MISVYFQGKPFNITVIQVYAQTSNAKEAEVEWFYEDLQDLLELAPQKDVLFIIGYWNAKVGSQEICGVTGKFGPGGQNEAEQRLWDVLDKHQLSSLDLMCHLRLVFPYCFSVCISVHWRNCDVKVPHYYCVSINYFFYVYYYLLKHWVFLCWETTYLQLLLLFLD